MKTTGSRASAVSQTRGFGDLLYDKAGARPSLDLDFAGTSSLRDKITGENLVDHTRGSKGTYIDSDGLIKEAAINYVTNHKGINNTTGYDSILNPEGNLESIPYITGAPLNHRFSGASLGGTAGQKYTGSVYLRTDQGTSPVELDVSDQNNTIVTVTDQWQRFVVVQTNTSVSGYRFFDILTSDGNSYAHIGQTFGNNGSSKIYVWGAQLEEGISGTPTDLIKTTGTINSAPRFTHERVETGNLLENSERLWNGASWSKRSGDVVIPNFAVAPDGKFSASKYTLGLTGTQFLTQTVNKTPESKPYTLSIHFKKVDTQYASIRLQGNYPHRADCLVDLDNETISTSTVGSFSNASAEIVALNDNWYRVSFTAISDTHTSISSVFSCNAQNVSVDTPPTVSRSVLLWGAQLEEARGSSVYTPSIDTFTNRLSNASYVDSAGFIKHAAFNFHTNHKTITQNDGTEAIANPEGLVEDITHFSHSGSGTLQHRIGTHNATDETTRRLFTGSIYLKTDQGTANVTIKINDRQSQNITVTDQWQRFSVTQTSTAVGVTYRFFDVITSTSSLGDGGSTKIYAWGGQIELGPFLSELTKTTGTAAGAARYSHDSETLTPTGLFLEPASTNLFAGGTSLAATDHLRAQSRRNFDMATNMTPGSNGRGANLPVACPDGSAPIHQNGLRQGKATYSHGRHYQLHTEVSIVADTWMTMSIFVNLHHPHLPVLIMRHDKNTNDNGLRPTGNTPFVKLNSDNTIFYGPLSGTTSSHGSWEMKVPKVTSFPNNWVRLELTVKTDSTGLSDKCFGLLFDRQGDNVFNLNSLSTWSGLNNQNNYYWGLQIETGTFASSFIKTGGGTVTRAADIYTSTPNLTETFEPRGLLIEEARTNLATKSHLVGHPDGNGDWQRDGTMGSTPSNPNYTNPMGTTEGLRTMIENGNNSVHNMYHIVNGLDGTAKCTSVFVKPLRDDRDIQLRAVGIGNNAPLATFDVHKGVITYIFALSNTSGGGVSWTMGQPFIKAYANGWYRIGFTNCAMTGLGVNGWKFGIYIVPKGSTAVAPVYQGTNEDSFSCWGAQYENGSFPTSYIHNTTSSSLTRSADVATITGDNFGTYRTNLATHSNLPRQETLNGTTGIDRLILISNYGLSPSNQYDSTKLIPNLDNSGVQRVYWAGFAPNVASRKTFSLYAKASGFRFLHIRNRSRGKCFDLINGTMSTGYYDGTTEAMVPDAATMEDVGNGWYRCSVTTPNTTNFVHAHPSDSATTTTVIGNGKDGIEVYGFQIEEGYLTNYIPSTDTFTTRLGNGTYVDSNGLIKTSALNKLQYSEQPDNAYYTKPSGSVHIDVNVETAPDGTLTADKIKPTAANTNNHIFYRSISMPVNSYFSIHAKAAEMSYLKLIAQNSTNSSSSHVNFNLANGTVHDEKNATGEIISLGNGWYRCIMKNNTVTMAHAVIEPNLGAISGLNPISREPYAGNNTDGLFVWGIMLSDAESDYVKTEGTNTGAPRYSHDPETLVPTGLILEPSFNQTARNTETFTVSGTNAWQYSNGGTLSTDNTIINPDGSTGTAVLTISAGNQPRDNFNGFRRAIGNHAQQTISCFVKKKTARYVTIAHGGASNYQQTVFDFDTESIYDPAGVTQHVGNLDRILRGFQKYPNGWYRIYLMTGAGSAGNGFGISIPPTNNPERSVIGGGGTNSYDGTESVYVWGFNCVNKHGLYNYVPNEASNSDVSFVQDSFTSTATTVLDRDGGNKEAFFTPTSANSVFVAGANNLKASSYPRIFSMSKAGNTSFESWNMYFVAAGSEFGKLRTQVKNAANPSGSMADSSTLNKYLVNDSIYKGAAYIDQGSSKISFNGILGSEDTSTTLFNPPSDGYLPNQIQFGNRPAGSREYNGTFNRLTFWKTRLPDASLINITNT